MYNYLIVTTLLLSFATPALGATNTTSSDATRVSATDNETASTEAKRTRTRRDSRANARQRNGRQAPAPTTRHSSHRARVNNRTYWAPSHWAASHHRHHLGHVSHWNPRWWTSGVFYYNAAPPRHSVIVAQGRPIRGRPGPPPAKPTRSVNRDGNLSVGLLTGSYASGYYGGGHYSDLGLGLSLRYRMAEAVGLEMSYVHHSQSWETETQRLNAPLQASIQLFAFPWTRVSPYFSTGLTWTARNIQDDYYNGYLMVNDIAIANDVLFGPHAGLGVEFAIGDDTALSLEGRIIDYLNIQSYDASAPEAAMGMMGVNVYF